MDTMTPRWSDVPVGEGPALRVEAPSDTLHGAAADTVTVRNTESQDDEDEDVFVYPSEGASSIHLSSFFCVDLISLM